MLLDREWSRGDALAEETPDVQEQSASSLRGTSPVRGVKRVWGLFRSSVEEDVVRPKCNAQSQLQCAPYIRPWRVAWRNASFEPLVFNLRPSSPFHPFTSFDSRVLPGTTYGEAPAMPVSHSAISIRARLHGFPYAQKDCTDEMFSNQVLEPVTRHQPHMAANVWTAYRATQTAACPGIKVIGCTCIATPARAILRSRCILFISRHIE